MLFCICLTSCNNDLDVVTDVKYSVYENDGSDMISFYMTSDIDPYGIWEYTIGDSDIFEVFHTSDETKEYGNLFEKREASYPTLILKPKSEGKATVSFSLTSSEETREYNIEVTKDTSGILRIKIVE